MKWRFIAIVFILLVMPEASAREAKRSFSKATIGNYPFEILPNATAPTGGLPDTLLVGLNGTVVERYGDATLVEIHGDDGPELKRRGDAHSLEVVFRDEFDKIYLNGRVIDAREGTGVIPPNETADPPYREDEQGTFLIQFWGPIKDAWLDDLKAVGIVPVQPVPMNAYVVGARRSAIAHLASRPWVQYTSQLHRFLKPSVGHRTGETVELWIQLAQTDETEDAVSILSALSVGSVKSARWSAAELRVQGVFRTADLDVVLAQPLVWMIAERPVIDFSDERATLGVTDMVPGIGAVAGKYQKWLTDVCPACADMVSSDGNNTNDFYIGIADTGLDGGSDALSGLLAGEPAASGLLRDELLPETPRIRWGSSFAPTPTEPPPSWNCATSCPDTTGSKHDTYGHGTMVAGVAVGNPPATGAKDSGGFLFGLGVAPSAGLTITKIMPRRLLHETNPEELTPVRGITRDALQNGPAYWQNFSVNQYYDTQLLPNQHCMTMYDGLYSVLSRDFDVAVRDGNDQAADAQPITLTVSSGNIDQQLGATTTDCSWMQNSAFTLPPATAKNVIAVGGGENVRPDPWFCGGAGSDSYTNLAFNAKRGTATAGWYKPDLVAVSSNISSLLSNDAQIAIFCPSSPGAEPDPLYRGGTGTSFAAPVGAAAAALASRRYDPSDPDGASPALVKAMLVAGAKSMRDGLDRVRLKKWRPGSYNLDEIAIPTNPNGFYYQVVAVTIGNGAVEPEPAWPLAPDGEIQHQGHLNKRFTWRNMGEEPRIAAFPNGEQGFGRISLRDVLSGYPARHYVREEPLVALSSWSRDFIPHDPSRPVRIALAWSDLPGTPQSGSAQNPPSPLINDLHLSVEVHDSGNCLGRYFGNRLDTLEESVWHAPCTTVPSLDAENNVEVIRFFATPGQGAAGFTVKVTSARGQSQPFSLVVWNAYLATSAPPPSTPTNFLAVPASAAAVTVSWDTATQTTYELQRSTSVNDPYVTLPGPVTSPYPDSGRSPMTTYLYRLRALNGTGASEWTFDIATTAVFTDPVLVSGTTTVKAAHVTELRQAVAAARTAAALNTSWADDPLPAPVKTSHLTELRTKLDEARGVLGLAPLTYTDGSLIPLSSVIKAVHIQQLRDGVR